MKSYKNQQNHCQMKSFGLVLQLYDEESPGFPFHRPF